METRVQTGAWRAARVDNAVVAARCARIRTRSVKAEAKDRLLRLALSMVDLTTLEGQDTPDRVAAICRKALVPAPEYPELPSVAAVCVYPTRVGDARAALFPHTHVKVASVATGFPSGQVPLPLKLEEVRQVRERGADEVDMVIDRSAFLAGDDARVFDEIAAVCEAAAPCAVKVILETGELGTLDNVAAASRLAIDAGAHFIKTSTGKIPSAATLEVGLVMIEAIRETYLTTGRMVGLKPAGGIRTAKDALHWLVLVAETLGSGWLTPERFRFGASALVNDLLSQIARRTDGRYASPRRFSVD